MPAKKLENYINDDQLSRLIAKDTGITIKAIVEMREAQNEIIKTLLRRGKTVMLHDIGKFTLKDYPRKEGREFKRPFDGKIVWLDPKPAYQAPIFKFMPNFKKEIKEATLEKSDE